MTEEEDNNNNNTNINKDNDDSDESDDDESSRQQEDEQGADGSRATRPSAAAAAAGAQPSSSGSSSRPRAVVVGGEMNAGGGNNNEAALPLDWTRLGQQGGGGGQEAPLPIRYPSDVADIGMEETEITLVGTHGQKITRIGPQFSSTVNRDCTHLVLRSHVIRIMEGLEHFSKLQLLELYDNQITELRCLNNNNPPSSPTPTLPQNIGYGGIPGNTLLTLDMSYNVIRDMEPVMYCPNLQELYLANNKLKEMKGLTELKQLRKLDLGANKIRIMDTIQLGGLISLEELWLGKNKITKIEGLDSLRKLRRLDIQSNRLTVLNNIPKHVAMSLEEFYLAHNGIDDKGLALSSSSSSIDNGRDDSGGITQSYPQLSVLDLSRNRLKTTVSLGHLTSLDELWLAGNQIESFDDIQTLSSLGQQQQQQQNGTVACTGNLDTIYLEYNPIQKNEPLYRKKLKELIPSLKQIDANMIIVQQQQQQQQGSNENQYIPPSLGSSSGGILVGNPNGGVVESQEARVRRLQDMAIERARAETAASAATTTTTATASLEKEGSK